MTTDYEDKISALPPAKALAVGTYGESVASYRYRTLADYAGTADRRAIFLEMAEEEHGHHELLKGLIQRHYPGSDYVLTPEDKTLIIVGPRMIEVSDEDSLARALDMIYESECLTGRFYAVIEKLTPLSELKPLMKEMASECFDHAVRVRKLAANPDRKGTP